MEDSACYAGEGGRLHSTRQAGIHYGKPGDQSKGNLSSLEKVAGDDRNLAQKAPDRNLLCTGSALVEPSGWEEKSRIWHRSCALGPFAGTPQVRSPHRPLVWPEQQFNQRGCVPRGLRRSNLVGVRNTETLRSGPGRGCGARGFGCVACGWEEDNLLRVQRQSLGGLPLPPRGYGRVTAVRLQQRFVRVGFYASGSLD